MLSRSKQTVSNFLSGAIDVVLPPRCPISGEIVGKQGELSPETWQQIDFIHAPFCIRCGIPFSFETDGNDTTECTECLQNSPAYNKARSCVYYNDTSKDLLLKFKHADQTFIVHCFIPWLLKTGQVFFEETDYIVPVPLHRSRLMKRKYNQAGIIAKQLSKKTDIPACLDGVLRTRSTAVQGSEGAKNRHKNVRNAFGVNPKWQETLAQKSILLIDDVYTSGATATECTKALYCAGADNVNVLTVARVVSTAS